MTYRVVFRERTDETGERVDNPAGFLDAELEDGIVLDARSVGRIEPQALHSSDRFEEDDGFLASATPEIWEYDIPDDRRKDFEDALRNSGVVLEFEKIDSEDEMRVGA